MKHTPTARVPPLRYGQPAVLDPRVRRRTRCAAVPLRSNSCGELDHEAAVSYGTAATPASALLGTGRRGRRSREPNTGGAGAAPLAVAAGGLPLVFLIQEQPVRLQSAAGALWTGSFP